jgi:CelD/BcsL family acetyltransferase involved in cellulose biosynthesis
VARLRGHVGVIVLDVSRLSSREAVEKIREEWTELQDRSETVNPFVGPEWTIHWMRSLIPETDEAWILTVRDAGRLVGVAPMHLHTYRLGIRRLQMIGSGSPWVGPFEAPAVLAAQPQGRQVARALIEYLATQQRLWHLVTIALGESSDWLEPGWLAAPDFTVVAYKTTPFVVLPLPLAPRGPSEGRRNLKEAVRRARNRLTKRFGADGWQVESLTEPDAVRSASEELVRLHRDRSEFTARGEEHSDVLADPRVRAYILEVIADLAQRRRVTVYRLVAEGETLAVQLVLNTGTASFISISGFRSDAWDYSPTNYLQWVAVTEAAERGAVEVNFSSWPTQAKLRWSRTVQACPEFVVIGPSRFAKLVAAPAFLTASALSDYRRELGVGSVGQLFRRVKRTRSAGLPAS